MWGNSSQRSGERGLPTSSQVASTQETPDLEGWIQRLIEKGGETPSNPFEYDYAHHTDGGESSRRSPLIPDVDAGGGDGAGGSEPDNGAVELRSESGRRGWWDWLYRQAEYDFLCVPTHKRIVHTIIPIVHVPTGAASVYEWLGRVQEARDSSTLINACIHYDRGREHVHIVHDCAYTNSTCRCLWLQRLRVVPGLSSTGFNPAGGPQGRRLHRATPVRDFGSQRFGHLLKYFTLRPRVLVYYRGNRQERYISFADVPDTDQRYHRSTAGAMVDETVSQDILCVRGWHGDDVDVSVIQTIQDSLDKDPRKRSYRKQTSWNG